MSNHKEYFYICDNCGDIIVSRLDTIKNMKQLICRVCSNRKKGRENRDKIRQSTYNQIENGNWVLNSLTPEQEKKRVKNFSKTMKKKYELGELVPWNKGIKGKDSHMWIEDRTKIKEPINQQIRGSSDMKNWKKQVFKRDKHTCQLCNEKGGNLNAHHIKSFAEHPNNRFDIDNGITLCEYCYKWVHNINVLDFQ